MIRCHSCGTADPDIISIDEGIGPYEFHGATGTHTNFRDVTDCCHAEFSDMETDESLRTVYQVRGVKPSEFIYPHISDAILKEAVAAWLSGGDCTGLFNAACEKGFEDAVEYLDTLEGLENE